ncbi:MAG: DUF4159 domain-containing protein, partial [Bacteroidota bacterium]
MKQTLKILMVLGLLISHISYLISQVKVTSAFKIARLKYSGGGDWYNDPGEEVNLLKYIKQNTLIDVEPNYEFVEISSDKFFTYPFIFMTGHGNVVFSDYEAKR